MLIKILITRAFMIIQAIVTTMTITIINIIKFDLDWFTFLSPLIVMIFFTILLELAANKTVSHLNNTIKKLKEDKC